MTTTTHRHHLTPTRHSELLRAIAAARHPRLELPTLAHHYGITLADLQHIAREAGYPDPTRLRAVAAKILDDATHDAVAALADPDTHDAQQEAHGGRLLQVRVRDLHPDPANPRDTITDLDDLAASIQAAGLLQPIVARRHAGRLVVVAGHRRLAAVQRLGWDSVACIVRADMAPDDVLAAMLIENGQRAGLDPMEEARALARLRADGNRTLADLASLIGRNQVYVSARLALLALSAEDQAAVRAGDMNIGDAVRRGRLNAGRVRPGGTTGHPHLGIEHDLAARVTARCNQLKHKRGGRNSVGGVGCGDCWEQVIRADERLALSGAAAGGGGCPTCGA